MKKLLSVLLVILMLPWGFAHAELAAPQNPSWKSGSTATATWDAVEGADYYELTVYVYDKAGTNLLGSTITGTSATEVDVQQEANIIIKQQETEYTSVKLAYTVKAGVTDATNGEITYGAESAMSEKWDYTYALIKLEAPANVTLNSDGTVSWNQVDNVDYYHINITGYKDALCSNTEGNSVSFSYRNIYADTVSAVDGMLNCDMSQQIKDIYSSGLTTNKINTGDTIWLRVWIQCIATDHNLYANSEYSEWSNVIEYVSSTQTKLQPPSEITLNSDGTVSWNQVDNVDYYHINITGYKDALCSNTEGNSVSFSYRNIYADTVSAVDGMLNCDMSQQIKDIYSSGLTTNKINTGDTIWLRVWIQCRATDHNLYVNSEYSEWSNIIEYVPLTPVKSLTLSPAKPVLYVGNSIYLGKTITPEDAYYTTIGWSSDKENVVTVDGTGKITGVAEGKANVTAAIEDVRCKVPVTVYTISSNIEDEDDKNHVTDSAGDIIDDIVNNENPDISDTDIPEKDLGNIRDEIQDGLERGDKFFTDMKWYEENFVKYKENWGQIQKAARELNAQFAGAYNIEVEMYHKKDDGATHKIGCIEEFEKEITFAFDLPTGMSEIQSGYARKYVLVRIHRNEIEAIDMEVENGKVTAESDGFSDFILLYVDEKTESGVEIKPVADNVMSGAIDTSAMKAEEVDKFYESVLDPKDADQDVDIFLEVNELNKKAITDTVVKSIEDRMDEEDELVAYLDINLLKSVNDGELDPIKTLSKPIPITIELDKVVKGRTYYIIRVHEDEVTRIDGTLKGNKFTFYTDKFSTYALASEITPVHHAHHQGSGIKVQYLGGNSFSTTNSDTPIAVEIDGIPVSFIGNGKYFTVDCIQPGARWVTVKWRGITVTTNFNPDVTVACTQLGLPKTGDASVLSYALIAVIAAAVAIRKK